MRYLSGVVIPDIVYWEHGGLMLTTETGNIPVTLEGVVWAVDNGCFTGKFNYARWLRFLKKWQGQGECLFAVAPDVPFHMDKTIAYSLPYMPIIRSLGYPAALAIQNGVEHITLPWDEFDAIFIAGDKTFKTSRIARDVCEEAQVRGKHIHIARRNSARAMQQAQGMGAGSCDGTYLRFAPDKNWIKMQQWFERLKPHTQMELW